MAPALVFRAPISLSLTLSRDFSVLHLEWLDYLGLAGLQRLVRLRGQLEHLFTAHLILTQISCWTIGNSSWELTCQLFGEPLLEGAESHFFLLELRDLIADDRQQVEADLACCVLLDSLLDLLARQGKPRLLGTLAMADRPCLQTVKLVKRVLMWYKRDEMEHIIIFASRLGLLVHHEGILPREAIVRDTNHLRVADRVPFLLWWQAGTERAEVGELGAQLDLRTIHQNGQNGLGRAGVVDHLIGEEELRIVVCQSLGLGGLRHPLEEKDESVDRSATSNKVLG